MAYRTEDDIEKANIRFVTDELGYRHIDASHDQLLGRSSLKEVVLPGELQASLQKLNPGLPPAAITYAIDELSQSRTSKEPLAANEEIYHMLIQGIKVAVPGEDNREQKTYVRIVDFDEPENNDFLCVSQLTIESISGPQKRRPDLLLYVNGLPLVMLELKNASVKVKQGYDKNLEDYRRDIPQLFWYNLLVVISNTIQTRVGAFTAPWEHFFHWTRLQDFTQDPDQPGRLEVEEGGRVTGSRLSLVRLCDGLLRKAPLTDYLENFVLYYGGRAKIIAKNHQYYGVNNAVLAVRQRDDDGKLGVFWHTQGSGKSYSMIFFTRKVKRKVAGNWSFLIVTDRRDLDDQIFRNFYDTGTAANLDDDASKGTKNNPYRPDSSDELREYLGQNKDYVFTLIHKFGIKKGLTYPTLSKRSDWIVIVDEAHRTQYKSLAENMRTALPNAQYMAFTGTPLLENELTKDWFGKYISEYNFAQSIEDGATVPLYYKKSIPRVEQVNEDLVGDAAAILEEENLDEDQRRRLDREFSQMLQVVKREDRLREIARHIVLHYPYRLDTRDDDDNRTPMKAMVISIDKFTALRMYNYVQEAQDEELRNLYRKKARTRDRVEKDRIDAAIRFMQETKMAVVVSREGSEEEERKKFEAEGLDITPHRNLMENPNQDGQVVEDFFKDPNNCYRIVFVTAMWLTGFDAPAVSTLYLDKPMQNHNLMQAIARANRVFGGKKNGLIVDYFGVFRNLKKALANYAEGSKGKTVPNTEDDEREFPVKEFDELLDLLEEAMLEVKTYLKELGADMEVILKQKEKGFGEIELFKVYAEKVLEKDDYRKQLSLYVNTVNALYDSAKPDIYSYPRFRRERDALQYLRDIVERHRDKDEAIERARMKTGELLDHSVVVVEGFVKDGPQVYNLDQGSEIDLSKLDFAQLRAEFPEKEYRRMAFDNLRDLLEKKLKQMVAQNASRVAFLARFEDIIRQYNEGHMELTDIYNELVTLTQDLSIEQERAMREDLSEQELELYDLLREGRKLTKAEEKEVKGAARELLIKLNDTRERILIREWHKERSTQVRVESRIREILNATLPQSYDKPTFDEKTDKVFNLFLSRAQSAGDRGFAA